MVAPHPKRKIEQKRGPKPKNKDTNTNTAEATTKEKKPRKQRVKKSASDDKLITSTGQGINMTAMDMQDMLYQESQAQQLLMMQQRQMNLKNDQLM